MYQKSAQSTLQDRQLRSCKVVERLVDREHAAADPDGRPPRPLTGRPMEWDRPRGAHSTPPHDPWSKIHTRIPTQPPHGGTSHRCIRCRDFQRRRCICCRDFYWRRGARRCIGMARGPAGSSWIQEGGRCGFMLKGTAGPGPLPVACFPVKKDSSTDTVAVLAAAIRAHGFRGTTRASACSSTRVRASPLPPTLTNSYAIASNL